MVVTGENRSTWRQTCPIATLSATKLRWAFSTLYPNLWREMPTTKHLSHGTVQYADNKFLHERKQLVLPLVRQPVDCVYGNNCSSFYGLYATSTLCGQNGILVPTRWCISLLSRAKLASFLYFLDVVLCTVNPLNSELNPICYLLALLAHHFLHVSRIRVKSLTLRLLMSYIYINIWSAYSWCF